MKCSIISSQLWWYAWIARPTSSQLSFCNPAPSRTGLLEITSKPQMGSLETPTTTETNSLTTSNGGDHKLSVTAKGAPPPSADSTIMMAQESEATRKRRASMLPLEVGTRVMCRWRDGKYHPVRVIERRKMHYGGPNDYEYYVDYTESNRRLDEWVKLEQLDLDSVETVVDEKVEDKITSLKMTHHQKRKIDETNVEGHEELDAA